MRTKALEKSKNPKGFSQQFKYVLLSTHLVPCLGTTTFTMLMAFIAGQRAKLIILLPMVLLGQFTVGWYNDYLDRDRDKAAGRRDIGS